MTTPARLPSKDDTTTMETTTDSSATPAPAAHDASVPIYDLQGVSKVSAAVGCALQVAIIATGVLAPMMFVLGAIFTALWWTALRLGRKAEAGRPAA